ncbi:MAG TPA: diguanylate cyclase [Chloroflexi bacterium]|nr:diguanylate cyclase [Chloroflexota bacterium]
MDDEESIRRLLGRLCEQEGYSVVLAEDGASAFEALNQTSFEICIIDLHLPDTHGLRILRQAKKLYPDCAVIILTGHGDLQTALEALRLGAYDYLQKPLRDLQLILISISRALERQKLARQNEVLVDELQNANRELDMRRRQQIQYIHHIGQALAGALQPHDVARVLVQAMLGSIPCDAAGVLTLPRDTQHQAMAITGAPQRLSNRTRRLLVGMMADYLPETVRPDARSIQMWTVPAESTEISDEDWGTVKYGLLSLRDNLSGVVALARHSDEPFSDEAQAIFGILVSQGSIALENAYLFGRMRDLATRDSLTGLYNHGHFFEMLEAEIARAERYGQELAVIMLDLDGARGLKRINDTYGHQAGDELLRQVGRLLVANLRRADIVARYGGDEFVILAPQTSSEQAHALANRLCARLREHAFIFNGTPEHVTVSVGLTIFRPGEKQTASSVVGRADRNLYTAKNRGGDQVCFLT